MCCPGEVPLAVCSETAAQAHRAVPIIHADGKKSGSQLPNSCQVLNTSLAVLVRYRERDMCLLKPKSLRAIGCHANRGLHNMLTAESLCTKVMCLHAKDLPAYSSVLTHPNMLMMMLRNLVISCQIGSLAEKHQQIIKSKVYSLVSTAVGQTSDR